MANLGADFNSSSPTDADFVRHPTRPALPSVIRDVRARLKAFWGVMADLETGDFKDNAIPQAALADHPDRPSSGNDFYTEVTVDRRGLVIAGSKAVRITSPRLFRAYFCARGGFVETPDAVITEAAPPLSDWPSSSVIRADTAFLPRVYSYQFTVPAGVSRLRVSVYGGGWSEAYVAAKAGVARAAFFNYAVTPGSGLFVWVGGSDSPSVVGKPDYTSFASSEGYRKNISGPRGGYPDAGIAGNVPKMRFRPDGDNGVPGDPAGKPGAVLIEWYA